MEVTNYLLTGMILQVDNESTAVFRADTGGENSTKGFWFGPDFCSKRCRLAWVEFDELFGGDLTDYLQICSRKTEWFFLSFMVWKTFQFHGFLLIEFL